MEKRCIVICATAFASFSGGTISMESPRWLFPFTHGVDMQAIDTGDDLFLVKKGGDRDAGSSNLTGGRR